VQNVWRTGQWKKFCGLVGCIHADQTISTPPSYPASLDRTDPDRKIVAPFIDFRQSPSGVVGVMVHQFEQEIGGRTYQIEVTPVSNRWRAQLRRRPGMPTAMMPFYGATPDEAAGQLTRWLALAHQRTAGLPTTGPAPGL
jgi:hypothetical protein